MNDLSTRLAHLARIYDDGHDDLSSTGAVLRALIGGASVAEALGLDDPDDPVAKARLERTSRIIQPPPCSWCGDPADKQIHVGTQLGGPTGFAPRRLYAWVCGPCAREAEQEREQAMRDA